MTIRLIDVIPFYSTRFFAWFLFYFSLYFDDVVCQRYSFVLNYHALLCSADLLGSGDSNTTEDDRASKRRKRRRKRKAATFSEGNPPTADAADNDDEDDYKGQDAEERNKGNAEASECLSKNKRRKMKKKRHKEKLLALGIMPRSMALEFTYKQGEKEEEEEEGDENKVEEVLDFLRSTRDLYMSDCKFIMSIKLCWNQANSDHYTYTHTQTRTTQCF